METLDPRICPPPLPVSLLTHSTLTIQIIGSIITRDPKEGCGSGWILCPVSGFDPRYEIGSLTLKRQPVSDIKNTHLMIKIVTKKSICQSLVMIILHYKCGILYNEMKDRFLKVFGFRCSNLNRSRIRSLPKTGSGYNPYLKRIRSGYEQNNPNPDPHPCPIDRQINS